MELLIREAQPDDAEQVVAILNPIIEAGVYTVFDTPFTVQQERDYIESLPERGVFLVAEAVGYRIVGFQSLEPFTNYTRAFDHVGVLGTYVSLDHTRQGIARSLFQASFKMARQKAMRRSSHSSGLTTPRHWPPIRTTGFRSLVPLANTPNWLEPTSTRFSSKSFFGFEVGCQGRLKPLLLILAHGVLWVLSKGSLPRLPRTARLSQIDRLYRKSADTTPKKNLRYRRAI